MPVLPTHARFPDAAREVSAHLGRGLLEAREAIVRRAVDHTVPETIAVLATIFISMGLVMYWGIVKGGDCACGRRK